MPVSSITLPVTNSQKNLQFFTGLRSFGRRFSRFKIFHPLASLARSVVYTAEPAGNILIESTPLYRGRKSCRTITVISANLWHDFPHYRRLNERLEDFIQMVSEEDADILLLQEVARTSFLHAEEKLASKLNMAYVYSRANGHHGAMGFEEGLAIFSRFPIHQPNLQQLSGSSNPYTRRLVLGSLINTPYGDLFTFTTHLSILSRQNTKQAAQLQEWVSVVSRSQTAVIGGDFNTCERRPQIKQTQRDWIDTFRQLNPTADGATHELRGPFGRLWRQRRLDYIFIKPGYPSWKVLEAKHLKRQQAPHSDHHAVMTRLSPN